MSIGGGRRAAAAAAAASAADDIGNAVKQEFNYVSANYFIISKH